MKQILTSKKYKNICVNDDFNSVDFDIEVSNLVNTLDKMFPEKGSFEK